MDESTPKVNTNLEAHEPTEDELRERARQASEALKNDPKRLAEAEKAADRPDPEFDRFVDAKLVAQMKRVFGKQKRYPITLFQITGAMKAAGEKELPPRECGINGYNFVVPRGVPLMLPEGLINLLYQAGELNAMTMVQHGLLTMEQAARDMKISEEDAKKLANLGKILNT